MKALIETHQLCKRYVKTLAVDQLNLRVPEGSVTAFLGPNGAGKTTTLQCLMNLIQADSGKAEVLGVDSTRLGPQQFQQIAYVSENMELPLWMTVGQLLDYCRPMYPQWDRSFESSLLKSFALPLDRKLKALSRGMKMKAALLSCLAYRPKLVVLDEPFSGLDPLVRDEFIHGLLELTEEEGWTVLVSSHDIEEVERLTDRVAILHEGRLRLEESHEALQQRFRRVEVVRKDSSIPEPVATFPSSWMEVEHQGRISRFIHPDWKDADKDHGIPAAMGPVDGIEVHTMSLREIFVALARAYRLEGVGTSNREKES